MFGEVRNTKLNGYSDNKLVKTSEFLLLPHTVSIGRQSKVAVIPAAAPETNLSKFVASSFPDNLQR